jgi:hypothetical protein
MLTINHNNLLAYSLPENDLMPLDETVDGTRRKTKFNFFLICAVGLKSSKLEVETK